MDGLPVTIRLIDPPLHEFLPSHDELLHDVTQSETHVADLQDRILALKERIAGNQQMLAAMDVLRAQTHRPELPRHDTQVQAIDDPHRPPERLSGRNSQPECRGGPETKDALRRRNHARAEPHARVCAAYGWASICLG